MCGVEGCVFRVATLSSTQNRAKLQPDWFQLSAHRLNMREGGEAAMDQLEFS